MNRFLPYKKPILLWAHSLTQLALYWFYLVAVKKGGGSFHIVALTGLFTLTNFISFFILLEEREKNYVYRVCTTLLLIPLYFISEDFIVTYLVNDILLRYFFVLQLIFSYMDIVLEGHFRFGLSRLITLLAFLAIFLLSTFTSMEVNFLYMGIYFIFCLFPLLFFLVKKNEIQGRGLYSYRIMVSTAVFLVLYLWGGFYLSSLWNYFENFEEFYMVAVLAGILIYLLTKACRLSFKAFAPSFKEWAKYCSVLSLILFIVNGFPRDFTKILFLSLYLSAFFVMVSNYFNYRDLSREEIGNLLNRGTENLLLDKYARLYSEKNTRFLHDMILQDIILAQKLVQKSPLFSEREQILEILSNDIVKIRQELNAYDPTLSTKESLNNNYYGLIKDLEGKYQNRGILIDFTCSEDFSVPGPYDRFLYKTLYELVSNLFKHGKGDFAEIRLEEKQKEIRLSMTNYGDYLEKGAARGTGLKLLDFEIKRLDGVFRIEEGRGGEEKYLAFYVNVPIKKERIYEDYVNRRS
ncbi:hypothetical protein [Aedoeadaptatus coli]|uniref:hypothetical protein n=1 Tax=Aedoeadaptatus coli TaxID=2058292 RepID=UPI000D5515B2|nr:hypothetical protein [Peptoniphilus coli]